MAFQSSKHRFSHILELNSLNFHQATLVKPIHCKISWRLQESAVISKSNHKTTSSIFPGLTIPGEPHAKRRQNQHRKRIENIFFYYLPSYFYEFFPYHFTLPHFLIPIVPETPQHSSAISHIINIFTRNKICRNPFPSAFYYFFPLTHYYHFHLKKKKNFDATWYSLL